MKVGFFLREALRAMRRNAVPSFAAMATVLVTVLILGVFIPVVQATTGAANEVRGRVIANVYLVRDADAKDVARIRNMLENDTPHVASVEFVSKEQAYAEQRRKNPEYYDELGEFNPLPHTFRVTPDDPDNIGKVRNALSPIGPGGERTVTDSAIDEVTNREEDTNKILSVTRAVKLTTALLAGLLMIASVLLIANTIRLSLFARRREVEVMKLVGATDWFIRWPFVMEGMLVGFLGGLLAVLVLAVFKIAVVDPLAAEYALIAAPDTMSFPVLIALLLAAALLAPVLATHPDDVFELHPAERLRGPSPAHWFGTDRMGADVYSRLLFGARITILIGVIAVGASLVVGVPVGLVAGYYHGWLSDALMRVSDVFLAVPQVVLAIAIAQTLGPSLPNVILALSATYWPWFARVVYAETRTLQKEVFVESTAALGASPWRLTALHVLPNIASPIIVRASIGMGFTILTAAALGFLGLGPPPPTPEWGRTIAESREFLPDAWWYATAPGLAIFLTVMGFNLLGDGLRDVLDPRLRRARTTGDD